MTTKPGWRTPVLAPLLSLAYRRWRLGYLAAVVLAAVIFLVGLGLIAGVVIYRFLGSPVDAALGRGLSLLGLASLGGLATVAVCAWRERDLLAWVRNPSSDPQDPVGLWARGLRVPTTLALAMSIVNVAILTPAFLTQLAVLGFGGLTELVAATLGVVLYGVLVAIVMQLLISVAFQPVLVDLSRLVPTGSHGEDESGGGLGRRMLGAVTFLAFTAGVGVAGLSSDPGVGVARLLELFVLSFLVALTVGGTLSVFFTESVVGPIRLLLEGTARVARGVYDEEVPLVTGDQLGTLARRFNAMQAGLREREALHSAMGAYVDPVIAERVAAEGANISGEAAEVTVMFIDIVGFTRLAEGADPDDVVTDLNDFFDVVIPAIERHHGHANKLLGDGLMAVFGVPEPLDDHADRALAAARDIQASLLKRYEGQLKAGVGLNSGTVVVGSMGGGRKLDYTIIGDAVNVAARVEAHTRQTGDAILITDSTKALLTESDELISRGSQGLKGRTAPVELWAANSAR